MCNTILVAVNYRLKTKRIAGTVCISSALLVVALVLIYSTTSVAPEPILALSPFERVSCWVIMLLSLFLSLFFILNLRQSPYTIISEKVAQFRTRLLRALSTQRTLRDSRLLHHLELQRDLLLQQVKRDVPHEDNTSEERIEGIFGQEWAYILTYLYQLGYLSIPQGVAPPLNNSALEHAHATRTRADKKIATQAPPHTTPSDNRQSGGDAKKGLLKKALSVRDPAVEEIQGLYQISQSVYQESLANDNKASSSSGNENNRIKKIIKAIQ